MRTWVSIRNIDSIGYGNYPFEIHDRKLEATILEVKEDKVTYAYRTHKDDHLGDCIASNIPVEDFIKSYEPMQESIKFVCYRRGKDLNKKHIPFSNEEMKEILSKLTKVRIFG